MKFAIALAYITLSLPLGINSGTPTINFGVYPAIQLPEMVFSLAGHTTPLGYIYREDAPYSIHREEQQHIRQLEALGPAFYLSYALTLGEPFEPYRIRQGDYNIQFDRMWDPDLQGVARNFPQFRVTLGESPTVEFLPGYAEAVASIREVIAGGK